MVSRGPSPERGTSPKAGSSPLFPTYLLPSFPIPFRRRKPSASIATLMASPASSFDSTASTETAGSVDTAITAFSFASTPPNSLPYSTSPKFTSHLSTSPTSLFQYPETKTTRPLPAPLPTSGPRLTRRAPSTLRCRSCSSDLAFTLQIVSKGFTGRHGRAYLVSAPSTHSTPSCPGFDSLTTPPDSPPQPNRAPRKNLTNIRVGRAESRQLVTGWHVVADIHCAVCALKVGWKYVDAREKSQEYKIGRFILECARVVESSGWDNGEDWDGDLVEEGSGLGWFDEGEEGRLAKEGEVVFDSEDEDECDDVFAGVWNAEEVKKRRGKWSAQRRGKLGA